MAKALTAKTISTFKIDPDRRVEIPDRASPGLYLVVQPSGSKSWAMRYRHSGKPAKLTLGQVNEGPSVLGAGETPPLGGFHTLAEARALCAEQARLVIQGINPAPLKVQALSEMKRKRDDSETFLAENVVDEFVKRHVQANGLRSEDQVVWLFGKHITPAWKGRDIRSISRRDVIALIEAIADRGRPVMANRTLAHIRKMFSWAEGRDMIDRNPASGVAKPSQEVSRARVLSEDEIRVFWMACDALGYPFGTLFKFLLLTAQRRDEAAQMLRAEVVDELWTVPAARAKNTKANPVPLSRQASELLKPLPVIGGRGFVFTSDGESPVSGFSKAKARLDAKMSEFLGAPVPDFVIHDLRRTAATGLASLGIAIHISEAVLNHKSGTISGVAAIYNRFDFLDEKRRALQMWADKIDEIVTKQTSAGEVIRLPDAKR